MLESVLRRLALAATCLAFGLIVLGNLVRSTNSGLAYLTWPLYNGRVVPDREFHVLMEFSHRAVAGVLSAIVFALAAIILSRRELRGRMQGHALGLVALIVVQVLLGALTVWKLLAPVVVTGHLLAGQALFVLLLLTWGRARGIDVADVPGLASTPPGVRYLFLAACGATYAQILLGGLVSSHGAGLAAPDFPTLNGEWFPPLTGLVAYQAVHRLGAYVLVALLLVTGWRARTSGDAGVRAAGAWAARLVLLQVVLGALNVLWRMPLWITALHVATATALLGTCVFAAQRLAVAGARVPARRLEEVPA